MMTKIVIKQTVGVFSAFSSSLSLWWQQMKTEEADVKRGEEMQQSNRGLMGNVGSVSERTIS